MYENANVWKDLVSKRKTVVMHTGEVVNMLMEEQVVKQDQSPMKPSADDMPDGIAEVCLVCGNDAPHGLHILTRFICTTCEEAILQTPVEHERYHFFIERLSQLWVDFEQLIDNDVEQDFE